MWTRRHLLASAAVLVTSGARALAQLPATPVGQGAVRSDRRFTAGTELIPTPVTVRDAAGRLVPGLTREDFDVFEGAERQPVTQFTDERVPVSLVLLLDVSDSMRGARMQDARAALTTFVEQQLAPEDETALVLFNHQSRMGADWNRDRAPLRAALGATRPFGGTAIYDAVGSALRLFEGRTYARGAIVLVSDGADTASDMSVNQVKPLLARHDVFLYGIAVDSPGRPSSTAVNPLVFTELAAQSGGYAEVIASTADVAPAVGRIAEELNAQYLIGYAPVEPSQPGAERYRTIRVTTRGGHRVRARRGVVR